MVMLRVLRQHEHKSSDAPAGPPPRCLRFYPAARSVREFIKKITHPYPVHFLLPCCSALRLPCPTRTRTLLTVAARPICRRSLAPCCARLSPHPVTCAGAGDARSVSRALPAQLTKARCWWCWCSRAPLVLDASGARAPPLAAGSHLDA
jgi:hypothetical protein